MKNINLGIFSKYQANYIFKISIILKNCKYLKINLKYKAKLIFITNIKILSYRNLIIY